MQEVKPEDMSIPDRVAVLERGLDRERNQRKIQFGLVMEIGDYLEIVMDFLDSQYTRKGKHLYTFNKKAIHRNLIAELDK